MTANSQTHRHLRSLGKNKIEGGALLIVSLRELEFRNPNAAYLLHGCSEEIVYVYAVGLNGWI